MTVLLDTPRDATSESQALFNLAVAKINRNKFRDALGHLVEARRIAPSNPLYLSYFGYCVAQHKQDYEAAIRACRQAAKLYPLEPVIRVNLGKVYRLKGDNACAHREFLMAHHLDNRHPAPAAELTRMGVRRPSVLPFLPRSNWWNKVLGRMRAGFERQFARVDH